MQEAKNSYQNNLVNKIDGFVYEVYKATKKFPREELYGITSQLRRASISVALNTIEGYARIKIKVYQNFIEIAFGSLKESLYLIEFSAREGYISTEEYKSLIVKGDEISKMLWGIIRRLNHEGK